MHLSGLAKACESDIMVIYSPMVPALPGFVRTEVEGLSEQENFNGRLTVMLNGGLVDAVERTVEVIRHHYEIVDLLSQIRRCRPGLFLPCLGTIFTWTTFRS